MLMYIARRAAQQLYQVKQDIAANKERDNLRGFSMRVRVRLHGHLHTYTESTSSEFELELPTETTLAELIRNLKIPDTEIWVVSLNGTNVPLTTTLSNNNTVSVFPPVSGG